MNSDQMQGKWKQIKGSVKERWGKLTDDDIDVINGKHVSPANPYFMQVVQLCARLGATELLHPGNDAHHQDHVHIGFDAK